MSLVITEFLKGALGELYYKEGCDQKSWVYISLKSIHNDDNSSRSKTTTSWFSRRDSIG
jgi:hypothetical protein